MSNKERLHYLDVAKAIGIFFVISCHVIFDAEPDYDNYPILNNYIRIIYSFHMPLFYFISGVILSKSAKDVRSMIRSDFKSLIVPYIIWNCVYMVFFLMKGETHHVILAKAYAIVTGRGIAPLWFLFGLFLSKVLFCLSNEIFSRMQKSEVVWGGYLAVCFSILSVVAWLLYRCVIDVTNNNLVCYPLLSLVRGIIGTFFISTGYIYNRCYLLLKTNRFNEFSILIGALTIFLLLNIFTTNNVNMHLLELESFPIFMVTGVCGSIVCVSLCKLFNSQNTILNDIGKRTLNMMIVHYQPVPFGMLIINYVYKLTQVTPQYILIDIVMVFVASYLIAVFIDCLKDMIAKKYLCRNEI